MAFSRSKFVYLPHCRQHCHIDPRPRRIHLHGLHASESKLRILVTSNAGAWRTAQSLRSAPTLRCNRSSARRRTAQALRGLWVRTSSKKSAPICFERSHFKLSRGCDQTSALDFQGHQRACRASRRHRVLCLQLLGGDPTRHAGENPELVCSIPFYMVRLCFSRLEMAGS